VFDPTKGAEPADEDRGNSAKHIYKLSLNRLTWEIADDVMSNNLIVIKFEALQGLGNPVCCDLVHCTFT
jgi:hypothetical protein